ncbi:hypothetical protein [Listeria kieliensis]|uniref:hypothetical protein n=1 Tax=Listeria kieliensis TaxID=1621700 RepID=UPI001403FE95|nr:hypothetical protein [Listeria kieliensis]
MILFEWIGRFFLWLFVEIIGEAIQAFFEWLVDKFRFRNRTRRQDRKYGKIKKGKYN